MNNKYFTYIKNILFPCVIFSAVTGVLTACLIFLFKLASSYIISFSESAYSFVRDNPNYFIPLLLGCLVLGLISAFILKYSRNCRGGGIPTSVAILRGLISFHWIKSITLLPLSALLTYLCGVPLGNEGPSVQMGTAIGKGAVKLFSKKHAAWNRYIMTGGACAGFATATGAPVSGIFFALEEAHRRFSPMIIMVAATSVISGSIVMDFLCSSFNMSTELFDFVHFPQLTLAYIWIPVIVGIICGVCAGLFTKLYNSVNVLVKEKLANKERYQTVYSKVEGSSAAPTAGLHFTNELLDKIKAKGIKIVEVLLHVGLGTFRPVKEDNILNHKMHSEYFEMTKENADILNKAKSDGRRVIAVGTTSVRVLESSANETGKIIPQKRDTNIFIYPSYKFKVVDALITNFHLPESTLIMLVSAFYDRDKVLEAYNTAVSEKYRFFSFGDCMFLY